MIRTTSSAPFAATKAAGFERFNLDLMHGLPGQTADDAVSDLQRALALGASHISWYQLTIEPRTEFALHPPRLPDEDALGAIEVGGARDARRPPVCNAMKFRRSRATGEAARHNLNYWTFGDYLGIGAGAHGKITFVERDADRPHQQATGAGAVSRRRTAPSCGRRRPSPRDARPGEFLLNALRLIDGVRVAVVRTTHRGFALGDRRNSGKRCSARGLVRATDSR